MTTGSLRTAFLFKKPLYATKDYDMMKSSKCILRKDEEDEWQ